MMHYRKMGARRAPLTGSSLGRIALVALVAGTVGGCIDPDSPLIDESGEGCDEFTGTEVDASLELHATAMQFVQAAADFARNAESIKNDVLTACSNIAKDLGAPDTWSSLTVTDDAISNAQRTGACDAAGSRLEAALIKARTVNARVAITVSRGECHLDFEEQARCDAACVANATCDSGSIQTRCEPGSLSVVCEGTCNAGATCVGTAELPANCMGRCESECVGQCAGECIDELGHVTTNNPNCHGKCASSCNGTCRGMCKVEPEHGLICGANVRCTGGCTGTFTEPACVAEFTPPQCTVDANCHAACSARVMENAVCDPTLIQVFADIEANPEVKQLVDTLETNLRPLFDAANKKGKLVLDAAGRLGDSGESLEQNIDALDGKSLACVTKAATSVGKTIGSIDVAVKASVEVTVTTTEHTE